VLNSLSGDFIAASVRCLAPAGRFLEIGKRDIWTAQRFAEVRPHGRYFAIDLAAMRTGETAQTAALLSSVWHRVERGELAPLPLHAFPLERAAEAFRFMAMAKHVGKVVLTERHCPTSNLRALDSRASYLVTGGLSGLGLLTAQRLVERGARHLILVGRRPPAGRAVDSIAAMRAVGAEVDIVQADVARIDEVRRVLASVPATRPLRGVVHAAGLLEDGALLQQRWARFAKPFGPKIDGSWALHKLTRQTRLDFFVMYSSLASVLGSSGQGNHAAANAFMDALAVERRSGGLPATSIAWGPWSEVGAAADRRVDARGIEAIGPQSGLDYLDTIMEADLTHAVVFPMRWSEFQMQPQAAWPMLADLRPAAGEEPRTVPARVSAVSQVAFVDRLSNTTLADRRELLFGFVAEHVARVIGASAAHSIDPTQPLHELGLDSLMAVDLRNRLSASLGLTRSLPATLVFDYPTVEALAIYLDEEVLAPAKEPSKDSASGVRLDDAVGVIDELSDAEIERLFAKKMQSS
jgi:NAD(P)-dependent dehydrogenase (short-subunit alcohol dehydrogenase family)